MRKRIERFLNEKVKVNDCRLYGITNYVQVNIKSNCGIEVSLNELMQLKEELEADDIRIGSIHTTDMGYCLMIEFYK